MFVRERLKTPPSPEAIELLFGPHLQYGLKDFDHMLRVHKAHTVMLVKQNIVTREVGAALIAAIEELQQGGVSLLALDPKLEDLFYNVEAFITSKVGVRVAGQLHTGRSRNDLQATIDRMHGRDYINSISDTVLDLRQSMLNLAAQHTETVMPGYTHLKPAQPISFGYYLSAVANALERDSRRMERVYETVNLCPLGAAALAGTSFPIDRNLTARLLGFDGLIENCLDAVASRDYALELMGALAILTTTLSRLASDLYVWQSDEFGMVELSDAIAGTSSIMPQKKNPKPLEVARARCAKLYGALMAGLGITKGVIFSNNYESGYATMQLLGTAVEDAIAAMRIVSLILQNITVDKDLMIVRARTDFSTVTELADTLVRRCNISFREAHAIVGGTVWRAVGSGKTAADITLDMLNDEARQVIGRDLELTEAEVRASLDPLSSIEGKRTVGGPAPEEVHRMITEAMCRLAAERSRLDERRRRLMEADVLLNRTSREL